MLKKIKSIILNDNTLSFLGYIVIAIFSFFTIFILTRYLSINEFGEFSLYLAGIALVETISYGINSVSLIRYLSGTKENNIKVEFIGSGWIIAILSTVCFALIIYMLPHLFYQQVSKIGLLLFVSWYPLFSLVKLPQNMSFAILQAKRKFDRILLIRILAFGSFLLAIIINVMWLKHRVEIVVLIHIITNTIVSLYVIISKDCGIHYIFKCKIIKIRTLFHFGKYSMATLLGNGLLRFSDILLISIYIDKTAVAVFHIVQQVLDLLYIPLYSSAAVALPKMSEAFQKEKNSQKFAGIFYRYSGIMFILFIPLVMVLFIFSKQIVWILGGDKYLVTTEATTVMQIFIICGLFTTIDIFCGVALDSINHPNLNFYKVLFMVIVNIIGDIIVLILFKSIVAVALVTILNLITGTVMGIYFLRRKINIDFTKIFFVGWNSIKKINKKNSLF